MSIPLEKILASDRLPSLPEVAIQVLNIARHPDPDFRELVEAIRIDPAIAGRILKTANSALLGMRTRASSIEIAVPRLGTNMVRALVLGFCLADSHQTRSLNLRPWYQTIWRESLIQAAAAEALAERQNGAVDPCNWFLAGLLQDIGRLALLSVCQEEYVEHVLDGPANCAQTELEQQYFGFTHVDVSAALCRQWNLEEGVIHAVACHHTRAHRVVPLRFASCTSLVAGLITASHISEYLCEVSSNLGCSREKFERLLLQVFAMRPNDVFRLLADVDSRVGEIASAFSVDIGSTRSLESILSDAQEVLSQLAVNSQMRLVNANADVDSPPSAAGTQNTGPGASKLKSTSGTSYDRWRDEQTECFSRTWLNESLTATLRQVHAEQLPLGMLILGLDAAAVRPTQAEDALVRHIAGLLKKSVRLSDSIVRFSDSEFLLMMSDINLDMLHLLADQIRQRLERDLPGLAAGLPATAFHIGAVYYHPSTQRLATGEGLLREVQNALRDAKRRECRTELIAVEDGKARRVECTVLHRIHEPTESTAAV